MPLGFLRRKSHKDTYRLLDQGEVAERPNPLPEIIPGIYANKPPDKFALLPELLAEMDETVKETLHLMRIPPGKNVDIIRENLATIMRIPTVYSLACSLRSRDLKRFLLNCHVLGTMLQTCAFFGTSALKGDLYDDLMPILLGIYTRFYGVQFMQDGQLSPLRQMRRFNMDDPAERKARDNFLARFAMVMDQVSEISVQRLLVLLNQDQIKPEASAILQIIRYSPRLVGRAATDLSVNEQQDVHQYASYVAVLYAVSSGIISTGKRLCLILTEMLDRCRKHRQMTGIDHTAQHNSYALEDLAKAARCYVLDFFRGGKDFSIYNEPDKIFVIRVEDEPGKARWACFHSKLESNAVKKHISTHGKLKNVSSVTDPQGEDLEPISDTFD